MTHRFFHRLPRWISYPLRMAFSAATETNYRFRMFATEKRVGPISYLSYDLLNLYADDALLGQMLDDIEEGEIIFDIGANAGDYALSMAAAGAEEVAAFEPNSAAFEKLVKNVEINGLIDSIRPYELALSDTSGTTTMYITFPHDGRSSFYPSEAERGPSRITRTVTVKETTMDEIVDNRAAKPPNRVKIDVEGHGLAVVEGGVNVIEEYQPVVYYEPHGQGTLEQVREFFKSMGYREEMLGYPWMFTPR